MSIKPYLKYIYEIIAIVIGITMSFMVDEWREEKQNRERTVEVLTSIKDDLYKEAIQSDTLVNKLIKFFRITDYVFQNANKFQTLSTDSLMYYSRIIWATPWHKEHNVGVERLKTITKLVVNNKDLIKDISEFYSSNMTWWYFLKLEEYVLENKKLIFEENVFREHLLGNLFLRNTYVVNDEEKLRIRLIRYLKSDIVKAKLNFKSEIMRDFYASVQERKPRCLDLIDKIEKEIR